MIVAAKPPSIPSIEEQIQALPDDAFFEIIGEEVVEIEPMGALAASFANFLAILINNYAFPRKLGMALVEMLFTFNAERPQRRPDVSFVPASQWPANLKRNSDPPALATVPSLAVEVICPTNTGAKIEKKRIEYFEVGVRAIWIVYPETETIHVYNSPNESRVISLNDTLDGGTAIPGFQVKVADVFRCIFPPPADGTP